MPDSTQERVSTSAATEPGKNVAVTTSVSLIAANGNRVSVTIQPVDGDLYIRYGTSSATSVTTSNGVLVENKKVWEERDFTGPIYGIASTGTVNVRVIEVG